MKKLEINWFELELAFDSASYDLNYYLDRETGEVLLVTSETLDKLEEIYSEFCDEENYETFDLTAVLPQTDLQDWQQTEVLEADLIENDSVLRFLRIPEKSSRDAYKVMHSFIYTVDNDRVAESLSDAISGRKPFRSFKDALYQYPAEEKRWFAYHDKRLREEMVEWLEENDIEPANEPKQKGSN